jgi:hypothetical protein
LSISRYRVLLEHLASMLCEAETAVLNLPQPGRNLLELFQNHQPRKELLQNVAVTLAVVENLAFREIKVLRKAKAEIETELGRRRYPGRPRALSDHEEWQAAMLRWSGQSWTKVLRKVNADLAANGRGPIPLSTLRTVVAGRSWYPAKKAASNSRKAKKAED